MIDKIPAKRNDRIVTKCSRITEVRALESASGGTGRENTPAWKGDCNYLCQNKGSTEVPLLCINGATPYRRCLPSHREPLDLISTASSLALSELHPGT